MVQKSAYEEEIISERSCSLCGQKLTEFGNKTLKDGILCRDCVKKASPWLEDEDYEKRSIDQMREHLSYRQENLKQLDHFLCNRKVEGKYSLYLDDENGRFMISKRKDPVKDNADLFEYRDLVRMSIIQENQEEGIGDLFFEIHLDQKEIDHLSFRVNEFPGLDIHSEEYKKAERVAFAYLDALNHKNVDEVQQEDEQ